MTAPVQTPEAPTKPRGRPRSKERHEAILHSTRVLLASGSYEHLTIEAIAARAGVSRQMIYNWWPSKAAVVTEAVMTAGVELTTDPPASTGDLAGDLRAWLRARFDDLENPTALALLRAMTAAAAESTNAKRIYDELALPTREYLLARITEAAKQGQLRRGADPEAVVDAIVGTMLLRTLSYGLRGARESADGLLDVLLQGMLRPKGAH